MTSQTELQTIKNFLTQAKKLLFLGKYQFIPRKKNIDSLTSLGLTLQDAQEELLDLQISDYYKGPKKDLDPNKSGYIWEFKKNIEENVIYIKLKIDLIDEEEILRRGRNIKMS